MKAVVAAFNKEKALVGAFSVIIHHRWLIVYSTSKNAGVRHGSSRVNIPASAFPPPSRVQAANIPGRVRSFRKFRSVVVFSHNLLWPIYAFYSCQSLSLQLYWVAFDKLIWHNLKFVSFSFQNLCIDIYISANSPVGSSSNRGMGSSRFKCYFNCCLRNFLP